MEAQEQYPEPLLPTVSASTMQQALYDKGYCPKRPSWMGRSTTGGAFAARWHISDGMALSVGVVAGALNVLRDNTT
jgi:hypothetical protein